jgi:blue copper oxidase
MNMKLSITALMVCICTLANAQYNNLWIPDTISGTTFNLSLKDTFVQFLPGNQTITAGINGAFWGPTLIFQKGDTVHMNVQNNLNDSTTLHWHGMHLPAVMDGGPYQLIPIGTTWQPYWVVTNNASTFWYHPHLHRETQAQLTSGLGGFIIVRDSTEATLALPRTYGVDDFPIVLTSRSFDSTNAFTTASVYGDYMLTNGTLNAQVSLPKQYVRLRILNAEIERGYNLGFSDNRTFYVIGNDGGLLDAPVAVTRVKLLIGERAEILVNLGADAVGDTVNLEAFNAGQEFGFPGSEPSATAPFGSLLNNVDFQVLHINVAATTTGAITALPATLVSNTYWTASDATVTRNINVTGGTPGVSPFLLDSTAFNFGLINQVVGLNNIEEWTVTNNAVFGHSFHIHDVQFKLISRSTGAVANYESGWKDTYYLHVGETVSFVAKFSDYADSVHPYMYHCHISPHEDGGMMGAFVVDSNVATGVTKVEEQITDFTLYPNPATNKLFVSLSDPTMQVYYVRIINAAGRTMYMLPRPQLANGIDISRLAPGDYFLQLTDDKTKNVMTRKFMKDGDE